MDTNKNNITELSLGLQTDTSFSTQPKGSQRFALNAVNETTDGDVFFRSNEESNEPCTSLPEDFVPIGKIYISKSEVALLLVKKDNTVSEIGILKNNCLYETHVNDEFSKEKDKLNFRVDKQIQGTFRLRLGCERNIYFTDDYSRPRYYNFDKANIFKNEDGTFAASRFNLSKEYQKIPEFRSLKVLDSGGSLEPGSINVSIRYLDEGLNPSEWTITSVAVNIYNKPLTESYTNIQGSINSSTDYIDFPTTDKALEVKLDNLDKDNYIYYQLAFIEASGGTGLITSVKYSDVIPTSKDSFIYTGINAVSEGTAEEILFFNNIIYKAGSIEQVENMLILGNTQGPQVNYCKLQKYASRIKSDVIVKKVYTNQISDPDNTKNPTVRFGDSVTGGVGYAPGEIYSYGIVYVFEDSSISPTYHIPGKNPNVLPGTTFSDAENVYPMSLDNASTSTKYFNDSSCDGSDYWGLDSEGMSLNGRAVRHHRFPLRSEIKLDLVKEEVSDEAGGEQSFKYYFIELSGVGDVTLPVTCAEDDVDCVPVKAPAFQVRITYTIDGVEDTLVINIDPIDLLSSDAEVSGVSNFFTSNNIVILKIEESNDSGESKEVLPGATSPKGLVYSTEVKLTTQKTEGKIYTTQILGIKFSGVDLPKIEDTAGQKVIGYYIVRNERTDAEKTILDSAVLVPTLENSKYISHGLLAPEVTDKSQFNSTVFGMISPEHKFKDKQFGTFDYIKQEGMFNVTSRNYSKTSYNDVSEGSSYDSKAHKSGNDDGGTLDGFSLTVISRDNYLTYKAMQVFNVLKTKIKQVFYLNALESRDINDGANVVYNISSDNKIGMIQLEEGEITPRVGELPYVILGKYGADPYSNFRTLPYYKESMKVETFNETTNQGSTNIFNGDSYVVPMRYTNTVFWDNRLANRAGKTSVWNYIIGGIVIVVGAVLAFFTAGATTVVIGLGVSLIGAGALFVASGVTRDAMVKAYNEEYAKGLRETALDDWVDAFYKYRDNAYTQLFGFIASKGRTGYSGPSDDEIQWMGDCLTDLWFDTTINISLRNKMVSDVPTFLDAPGIIETGNDTPIKTKEYFKKYYTSSSPSRYPISKLDYHINKKLLVYNSDNEDSREYTGLALGEYYQVNPDYMRLNKEKIFYHLALDYNCCTECQEDFPTRWHYSEQSFQEELTDNYRIFLPNNYKDLEGETGEITNIFKIGNDLFMHTEEALWQIPRSNQERVTDQIVSFIGTGSYGEVPARKIMDDDNGSSAGSSHKWGLVKTPSGVFFPSEIQRKIYQFDGRQLKPISGIGNESWFKNNMELLTNKVFYNSNGENYPYSNNPSNKYGSGYLATYDTNKERILFTKKDFVLDVPNGGTDFEVCNSADSLIIFKDFNATIFAEKEAGWTYEGIEDCKLKFSKETTETVIEQRQVITNISPEAIVIPFFDTTSMDSNAIANISATLDAWFPIFKASIAGGDNNLTFINPGTWNRWNTERWVKDPARIILENVGAGKDIILLAFVDESHASYHGPSISLPMSTPTATYLADATEFSQVLHPQFNSFFAVNYPIVQNNNTDKEYLIHAIAAIEAKNMTQEEVDNLQRNPYFTDNDWMTLKTVLQNNSYAGGIPLKEYGWLYKSNRISAVDGNPSDDCPVDGVSFITPCTFTEDIENLIKQSTSVKFVDVEITKVINTFKYIEGEVAPDPIQSDNSWTMSYSLKQNTWVSWHSYMPNFYINTPEKLYSWIQKSNTIWKHNKKGDYQRFYGEIKPFILEYVSVSTPLVTRLWEYLSMLVEVKKYDQDAEEFIDINDKFFNKLIAYNSRQATGLLELKVKNADEAEDFFEQDAPTKVNEVIVSRNERDWSINELRDIRVDYLAPIFRSKLSDRQQDYFIDKILNDASLDFNKDWTELESFRDKYLVVRLIFDNFAEDAGGQDGSTKIIMNFSLENETQSVR